ncbi:MAG: flagellar biosynthesis anti-sigma factor FlgM [Oceanidesulfovibrio sp.]
MDVKKTVPQLGIAERTETTCSQSERRGKNGAPADFAAELARCQEGDKNSRTRAVYEHEREARVQALKKIVAEGMYRADLHEVARNLLFNDNSEPLL